jgi:hypothetical protein
MSWRTGLRGIGVTVVLLGAAVGDLGVAGAAGVASFGRCGDHL